MVCLVVGCPQFQGYTRSLNDYSLFYRKNGLSTVYIDVYVNDILLAGADLEEIESQRFSP